jgi:hypothetical protein
LNRNNKRTLWRCSQPGTGIIGYNCEADTKLLEHINFNSGENLVIFDARPYVSALANRVINDNLNKDAWWWI